MKTCFVVLAAFAVVSVIPALAQPCPPAANWCSGTYQYDGMGNIRAIGNDTYIYDTAGRLVSGTADVQRTGVMSQQDYGYDAFGNRISATRAPGSVDCLGGCEQGLVIDPATNHITSNGALYDAAGNLIFIQNTVNGISYSATYTYDGVGSLTRATAGSDDRQFIYTADDERIAVKNGQSWTWMVRDLDGKILREFTSLEQNGLPTANRQWAKDYIWRDGLLLATVAPTTPGASTTVTQHFHLDHLGTPRLITNANGVQIGIHSYYPFGSELNLSPNEQPSEMIKFTGHERDLLASNPNTLDYMHARFYNPTVGRFLSADPSLDIEKTMRQPQMWNRYAYVMNNPLRYTDPDGRDTWDKISGFVNAFGSDNLLGAGRVDGPNDDYKAGQHAGDFAASVTGLIEVGLGGSGGAGSAVVSMTGVGALVGAPAAVVSGTVVVHGGATTLIATAHMMSAADGGKKAGDLISGSLKKSKSYRSELETKTEAEIDKLAKQKGPLQQAAKQMKKLIDQAERLRDKIRN